MMYARPMRCMGMLVLATMAAGCAPALMERAESSPRSRYERELRRARPHGERLANEWLAKGNSTAQAALRVSLPHHEIVHFTAGVPGATAYRFTLRRADRFQAGVELPAGVRDVFLELFEVVPGSPERLLLIARSEQRASTLRTLIPRNGDYVLLVQPRVEEGGRYRIAVGGSAEAVVARGGGNEHRAGGRYASTALAFPVQGQTTRSIGSVFGDPRDGGRRAHHGVDIFAPRGTPVLAAADGRITNVANTPVGGRVIWQIADDTGLELYYAHLHEQYVRAGQRVRAGDVIGSVGNTGNARTTPPHLHFGVYARNREPLDPQPMLAQGQRVGVPLARETQATRRAPATAASSPPAAAPAPVPVATSQPAPAMGAAGTASPAVDEAAIGRWLRANARLTLRATPAAEAAAIATVETGTPLRLVGGTAAWYRVTLPDGTAGFVAPASLAELGGAARRIGITQRTPLWDHAAAGALALETIYGGESVEVFAEHRGQLLVRTLTGRIGWIGADAESP